MHDQFLLPRMVLSLTLQSIQLFLSGVKLLLLIGSGAYLLLCFIVESRFGEPIQIANAYKAYCLEIPLPVKIKVAEIKNLPLMQSASNNKSVKSACLSLVECDDGEVDFLSA